MSCETTSQQTKFYDPTRTNRWGTMHECSKKDLEKLNNKCQPKCLNSYSNQFQKWVFWNARYVGKLHKEILRQGGTAQYRPEMGPWKKVENDNYLVLDVDQRNGRGPETVTFHNIPPGRYQVAVDKYSNDVSWNIKDANPIVQIYLGGGSRGAVVFDCKISDSCRTQAMLWNVVEIEVKKAGIAPDGDKYEIRLVDQKEKMTQLWAVNGPSMSSAKTVLRPAPKQSCNWFGSNCKWIIGDVRENYFRLVHDWKDFDYQDTCYGTCEKSSGTGDEYEGCLDKKGR